MNDSSPSSSPAVRLRDWGAVWFALLLPSVVTVVYFVWLARHAALMQQAAYGLGKAIQFAFPLFWVVWVQKQALRRHAPRRADLLQGGLVGLAIAGAMLVLYELGLEPLGVFTEAAGPIREKIVSVGVASLPAYVALGTFYALVHSLLEEYYWRWFVFGQLRRLSNLGTAIAVSSMGFMAHHVIVLAAYFGWGSPLTLLFSAGVAVGGALWAWVYHRTGSLYGPWIAHLLVDAAIFFIGYDFVRDVVR